MAARSLPKPLLPGARVGVFALAGPPDPGRLEAGIEVLAAAGLVTVRADNLDARDGYLAGTDEERAEAFRRLLEAGVEALVAARGGYGTMRVLDLVPWHLLADFRGWITGFSDLTALHSALATRGSVATLHAPVATTLARDQRSAAEMVRWLQGKAPTRLFRFSGRQVVRPGRVSGRSLGGNLAVLASLVGTPWEPEYDDGIVFIEDVNEPAYRLDRLLTQLHQSSRLARVRAIVVGRLHRCGRGEVGVRERFRRLLAEVAPAGAVVVDGLPFGHGARNVPFPLGVEVEVDTRRGAVSLGGS